MATNTTAVSLLDCLTHNNLITNLYSTLANNRLRCFFHAMKVQLINVNSKRTIASTP